uniref:Uncharacterized protein n=1 Tax=Lepeophtheirus salmonis TaxID=72036 RepID=A0A0K2V8I2_LEPSM
MEYGLIIKELCTLKYYEENEI